MDEFRKKEDELLGIIKKLENKLNAKIEFISSEQNHKIEEIENKIKTSNLKFDHYIESQEEHKIKIEKIDDLLKFQKKAKESITAFDIKINNLTKDLENIKFKYDKLFMDNLTIPGIIGDYCKYKSIRDYIENNIKEMANLNKNKEKSDLDFNEYKIKLESLINQFSISIKQFSSQQIQLVNEAKEEIKNKIDFEINIINEKIQDIRVENIKTGKKLD